jgi:hypothetical protein
MAEVSRLYPESSFLPAWWRYVETAFEAGQDFTPQGVATLTRPQLRDLSRTTRGLRQGLPANYLYRGAKLSNAA